MPPLLVILRVTSLVVLSKAMTQRRKTRRSTTSDVTDAPLGGKFKSLFGKLLISGVQLGFQYGFKISLIYNGLMHKTIY